MIEVIISAVAAIILVLILTAVLIWCGLWLLAHAAWGRTGLSSSPHLSARRDKRR